LHLQKANLLVEMDEPADALECLTQALQLDHNAATFIIAWQRY